jgi:hypothetical protein
MRRAGDARRISSIADDALRRLDPAGRRHFARAVAAWNDAVGEEIARHTQGLSIRDAELTVAVDSPVWANELTLLAEDLRSKVNQQLGQELVRSLRFTVSRKVLERRLGEESEAREERAYEADTTPRIPLSEPERAQVEYASRSIEDSGLREAAVRAMTADLELKKGARQGGGKRS